ncbi:MAG: helix-turn-helix domain-containing protein [Clostridiales bacterium]|nr:helix-turn-helix domain-containing protein [Clostridiales bacterium]
MSNLGVRLKAYRDKLSLSLSQVNKEVGITNSRLSKMERGKIECPPAEDLKKLASLYHVSVIDLYIDVGYLETSDIEEYQQVFHGVSTLDAEEKEYIQELIDLLNRKRVQ